MPGIARAGTPGVKLRTREELLLALTEAAEVEHMLAAQYLFAMFSMKEELSEFAGGKQADLDLVTGWRNTLLEIALQEMGHLATVNNLLAAIGGASHFTRPNFPQPAVYYGPKVTSELERFSMDSLRRFVEFERPENQPGVTWLIAPVRPEFKHVGELYEQIKDGFASFDTEAKQRALFLSADVHEEPSVWAPVKVKAVLVKDAATGAIQYAKSLQAALDAIDWIKVEGEGTPDGADPNSHYRRFFQIATDLRSKLQNEPGFEPARLVAANPQTEPRRDAPASGTMVVSLITNSNTKDIAELFDALYNSFLLMFTQYFAFDPGESSDQRKALRSALKSIMNNVISPLGSALTRLPLTDAPSALNAGPGFGIPGEFRLSTITKIAWPIVIDRLSDESKEAARLQGVAQTPAGAKSALASVQSSIDAMVASLKSKLGP
jgi:hypothetical protein